MGANFIDIKSVDLSTIDKEKVFAIDTNVLLWTHYSKASDPNLNRHPYQVFFYPDFVAKLLGNGNKLVTTILNISELVSVVEKNEYKIYKLLNNHSGMNLKDFRKIPGARQDYKAEISNIIMEIGSSYNDNIEIIDITKDKIDNYCSNIDTTQCDVFDFLVINHLKNAGITNYISDDKDFLAIDGINLYTTYGP